MPRLTNRLLALATLSAAAAVLSAQAPAPAATNNPSQSAPSQSAPIERSTPSSPMGYPNGYHHPRQMNSMATLAAGQPLTTTTNTATARPTPGILIRLGQQASLTPLSIDPQHTELRLDRGVLNLNVHRASDDDLILVDLPGGQTHPLKSGLYTFNAATSTVRVLKGEAEAFPTGTSGKAIKVKENHAVTLTGSNVRSEEFDPFQARADLIPYAVEPGPNRGGGYYAPGYPGFAAYGPYSPYGAGFYGDYGYPYAPYYGYGYGAYPFGFGLGFGYYGGLGGFRGGYGGFHGGGFHGHR